MIVLGIDIGGSGIKGAPVDLSTGTLIADRHRIPTPQPSKPVAVAKTVKKMVQRFKWDGPIGIGFPAVIQHGIARTAANVDKSWINTDAETLFKEATECPVKIVNDADAAGLAEVAFGGGKGISGLTILLTIGTGIGSAIVQDGVLIPNSELGHLKFKGKIAEHYAADSARKREELSWKEWGKRFDEYLNHVYDLFYPDLFILGGGASKRFDQFEELLTVPATVVPAKLLNEAGIVGAALAGKPSKGKKIKVKKDKAKAKKS